MTKLQLVGFAVLTLLSGCGDHGRAPADEALSRSNGLIGELSTWATVRAVVATEAIRTNLASIADCRLRLDIIGQWKRSLYNMPVDSLRPSERYACVSEAYRVVTWSVVGAMWDIRESYEDAWSVYLEALDWLDDQCHKMKPAAPQKGCDVFEEREKWKYYRALAEYRESVIENLEINGFDERIYHVGKERMDAVRKKFETVIGRHVRPREDIKLLGRYVKEVRAEIDKERDRALSKARVVGEIEKCLTPVVGY